MTSGPPIYYEIRRAYEPELKEAQEFQQEKTVNRAALIGGRMDAAMDLSFAEVQAFVSDLGKARNFYEHVLGLKLVKETEKWLIFDVSGTTFIVMAGARPRPYGGAYGRESGMVLCLLSENIDRDFAKLKAQGVHFFSEVNEVPEGRYVGFQDPDGNLLELIQK